MTEFDQYAASYDAGMDNRLKAMMGESADAFVAVKLRWLLRRFPDLRRTDTVYRILDYGCGVGTLLRLMAESGIRASLIGCDVATGMLDEAIKRWPEGHKVPELRPQDGARTPVTSMSIDLVVVSAVLHHVTPAERPDVYGELWRVLRPGGRVVVFEHNPINPVTRYVVARTPIDRNAILLRASEVCAALGPHFTNIRTSYLMFLPPALQALGAIEAGIGWLPLGAQYAVTASAL